MLVDTIVTVVMIIVIVITVVVVIVVPNVVVEDADLLQRQRSINRRNRVAIVKISLTFTVVYLLQRQRSIDRWDRFAIGFALPPNGAQLQAPNPTHPQHLLRQTHQTPAIKLHE